MAVSGGGDSFCKGGSCNNCRTSIVKSVLGVVVLVVVVAVVVVGVVVVVIVVVVA